ncbi:dihydroorotate dehydrogenase electron transfer subunit [Candidatus Gracilibacteria bacterium]|nr:dihydroorotate dehydrogenase electron transfer subunit [Candidatus Gracilibacteria bacterium]
MNVKNHDTRFEAMEISEIVEENSYTKTYVFKYDLGAKPGQFVMLWVPGVDEKPFSVAYCDSGEFWLTICAVGPCSKAIYEMKVGDRVGIRGPFGTEYDIGEGEHLALVSGGYGAAPMYFVAKEALKKGCKVEFLTGARSEDLLLFEERVAGLGDDVTWHCSTDDGSKGFKGYVTQLLSEVMKDVKLDKIFACGPEVMMKAAGEAAGDVPAYLSMEKYMKCGFGVCGQCAIDDTGDLCCKKGPVMAYDYVKGLSEFGKYHRDAQGKKNEY